MRITHMKTNHIDGPLGFDLTAIHISYIVEDCLGSFQTANRVQARVTGGPIVYDSGKIVEEIHSLNFPLASRTRYEWRVCVWTDTGETCWSPWAFFETALLEPWQARFITSPLGQEVHPVFFKEFTVREPVIQARLYGVGLGEYEVYLDGQKVGDEVLLPGLHTFDAWIQYQTFELEISKGGHLLEIILGDGWYKGRYGLKMNAPRYGDQYGLIAQLHMHHEDGTETVVLTDESWKVRVSPIVMDGIYDGETVDMTGKDSRCLPAVFSALTTEKLSPRLSPYLKVQERLRPTVISKEPLILDVGQNLAGWCEFFCDAPKGAKIEIYHGELVREGRLYRDNLRTAASVFTYISDGIPRMVRPHFTYFGFRYVQIEGWAGELDVEKWFACAIYSTAETIGNIHTSDEAVNKLIQNTLWTQKSNFLDVPTDCPQRDERMGWTGDAQVFCDTACFNMDATAFWRKFLRDLSNDQKKLNGSVPCIVPMANYCLAGVTAWGDAATVIPWHVYLHTGDETLLSEQFESMKAWVDFIQKDAGENIWRHGKQLGDWLALDGENIYGRTDQALIATAYYYYSALLTAKAGNILHKEEAQAYLMLAENIKQAFIREFFTLSGRLSVDTQTAYAMVIFLSLCPDNARERLGNSLREKLLQNGCALDTGFVGTPWLLPALSMTGSGDLAYRLLLRHEYPSWLYEVDRGATTVWERWNSIEPDGQMNRDGMNSLNHYANGSVVGWIYRFMGGIHPMAEAPGFRQARIAPMPDRALQAFDMHLNTASGEYRVAWAFEKDDLILNIRVPFGAKAHLLLPFVKGEEQLLSPGEYCFTIKTPPASIRPLEWDWRVLASDIRARPAIEKHFPRMLGKIAFQDQLCTLGQVLASPFSELSQAQEQIFLEELQLVLKNDH